MGFDRYLISCVAILIFNVGLDLSVWLLNIWSVNEYIEWSLKDRRVCKIYNLLILSLFLVVIEKSLEIKVAVYDV